MSFHKFLILIGI